MQDASRVSMSAQYSQAAALLNQNEFHEGLDIRREMTGIRLQSHWVFLFRLI